ncbi:MAG: 2Fe-2S iron-sulfur cluster-binding protein [Candidatus Moduliflexus flocculans]|nr:2Fe-2S iron-sulfur cluster-binding protein [Candidatus Moduliflexus flocculans]
MHRIEQHPILPIPASVKVPFTWKGQAAGGPRRERPCPPPFSPHGVRVFGHHAKDGAAQGIFCANGQCAQCLVLADGLPVKSCMELVAPGMRVRAGRRPARACRRVDAAPPRATRPTDRDRPRPVLIIGGGPAGLSAAIELGKRGHRTPSSSTTSTGSAASSSCRRTGSSAPSRPSTPGRAASTSPRSLEAEVRSYPSVRIWLRARPWPSSATGRSASCVGGRQLRPGRTRRSCSSRPGPGRRSLAFPGNTLPGVYGAGAFQTLVNRDLVRPTGRLFIVGGGNVGLIAGYHALQAGIAGGRAGRGPARVRRLQGPQGQARRGWACPSTRRTRSLSANGTDAVESVTIARVDEQFRSPSPGTERSFDCDTLLIAVGLDPVDEFYDKAREFGLPAFAAGDAEEIAEASAAIFSGKIRGLGDGPDARAATSGRSRPSGTGPPTSSSPGRGDRRRSRSPERRRASSRSSTASRRSPAIPARPSARNDLIRHRRATDIRGLPGFVGDEGRQGLHRLREMRRDLPRPGRHPRRLPQGRRTSRP